jgi:beta-galactosidase
MAQENLNMVRRWRCLPVLFLMATAAPIWAQTAYVPPASPRATLNFNPDWKFIREDVSGAQASGFDDAAWSTVSTPHTYNDVDTFNRLISHSGGQQGAYMGPAWYRKHFKLPADMQGRKLILEFEGLRQTARFYVNGKELGLYENGITAYGLDITGAVQFGDADNVLAVRVDNSDKYQEEATKTGFQWESKDFNPNYGGLHQRVWLHVAGKIYQTLPIYEGLKTTGTYIYPSDIAVNDKTATINVESQVANESGDQTPVTLSVAIVDGHGILRGKFDGDTVDMVNGEKSILKASGKLSGAEFWSPDHPAMYDVYTILNADGKVIDVKKTATGFRKAEFRGGAGTGGIYINDKFTYLTGYAQRSTDEWAGLGQAYPDWMHDLNAHIVRDSNANYMRWMHISPQKVDVEAYDRAGIVEVCPAGDKEKDVTGIQWNQRMAVMRDSIIYYRNNPSVLFWEAGNNSITPEHMQQMVDLRKELDPSGGRAMGCRTLNDQGATPITEYFGVMIGQDPKTDALKGPEDLFRAYSAQRRDRLPLVETEDFRDEGARRFWDDFSPPHFGFKKGPNDTYAWNSETFCLAAALRYHAYDLNRISNTDPAHSKWAGYASIYFFDSNADGRQQSSEVCRVSGKVDAVRLPKQIYYTYQVMQNPRPQVHIIGHWNYPAETKKTIYVASNTPSVELLLNGQSIGKSDSPARIAFDQDGKAQLNRGESTGYIFAFADVAFRPGTLRAVGLKDGKVAAEDELKTAGPAASIRLTPHTGPRGLQADGQDVAFFDVEVVDANGERCPTDEGRIDFDVTGPCIWRGGYNSGVLNSTNNKYLSTECGINRVAVRATLTPGPIMLTAKRPGLAPATVTVDAVPFDVKSGLSVSFPPRLVTEVTMR